VDAVLGRGRTLSSDERDRLFRRVLTTTVDDGIVLQPLYTRADLPEPPQSLPGQPPFVRSATASGPLPSGWQVCQRVDAHAAGAPQHAERELQNGATALWLDLGAEAPDANDLAAVLEPVPLDRVPVTLDGRSTSAVLAGADALRRVWQRRGLDPAAPSGSFGLDPIGAAVAADDLPGLADDLAAALSLAATSRGGQVRPLVVDTARYHDAGATDADAIAIGLATGVAYVRGLVDAGLDPTAALASLEFRYAATDDQFVTLATLRAARRTWARVAAAWGVDAAGRVTEWGPEWAQRQHAVTSRAMLTRYDPWVNLLRTTVATFAAGLGGAAAVTVLPHDLLLQPGDHDLGRRLARNVQSILLEEAQLGRVIDPAGGSWFVERLTHDLATRAWERFQQIEAAGGMPAAWQSGPVPGWVEAAAAARARDVARRRRPVTGVSEFPNPADVVPAEPATQTRGLPVRRWAAPFEALRDRAAAHRASTGSSPRVFLAPLGPLAEHTARASFCTNLFAAGGLEAVDPGTTTASEVADAFRASGAAVACIVGSNDRYEVEAADVARALASAGPRRLYLAGDPGPLRATLEGAGVDDYVVAGGDAVATLDEALTAAGVA
jgi:methylmalonyl-CoA mutase